MIAARFGLPFGAVMLMLNVVGSGEQSWAGKLTLGAAAGAGFGVAMSLIETGILGAERFRRMTWRDRIRLRREGVVTLPLTVAEARRFCATALRLAFPGLLRIDDVPGERDRIDVRTPSGGTHWGGRARLRFLPGPDGTTHLCYSLRPRFLLNLSSLPSAELERVLLAMPESSVLKDV